MKINENKTKWVPLRYKQIGKDTLKTSNKYLIRSDGAIYTLSSSTHRKYSYGDMVSLYSNDDRHITTRIEFLLYDTFCNASDYHITDVTIKDENKPLSVSNLKRGYKGVRHRRISESGEAEYIIQYDVNNHIVNIWFSIAEIVLAYSLKTTRTIYRTIEEGGKYLDYYWKLGTRESILREFGEVVNF